MNDTPLTETELARLREAFTQVPFAHLLGMEFVAAERGAATMRLKVRDELTRMESIVHGGVIASLLDTAAAFAVLTLLEPDERTVTVDLTIHYLRPATSGEIQAQARVLRAGRRLVILAVQATDPDGDLIATSTMTYVRR